MCVKRKNMDIQYVFKFKLLQHVSLTYFVLSHRNNLILWSISVAALHAVSWMSPSLQEGSASVSPLTLQTIQCFRDSVYHFSDLHLYRPHQGRLVSIQTIIVLVLYEI